MSIPNVDQIDSLGFILSRCQILLFVYQSVVFHIYNLATLPNPSPSIISTQVCSLMVRELQLCPYLFLISTNNFDTKIVFARDRKSAQRIFFTELEEFEKILK